MKNEVKKKMHALWRAMLYQSHRRKRSRIKISTSHHPNASQACNRDPEEPATGSPRISDFFSLAMIGDDRSSTPPWRGNSSFPPSGASIMMLRNFAGA
jgi:hypothetical protein